MSIHQILSSISCIVLLSACSHNIQLTPKNTEFSNSATPSQHAVAYYISEENKVKEVTTPGGGGDSVTYKPYKDTETALYTVLSNKFSNVYKIKSLDDKSFIKDKNIEYIFTPTLETDSSSDSALTWPPTEFTISLTCNALDAEGKTVWTKKVNGKGQSEFDEFQHDFSLSARRATTDTLKKLANELDKEAIFNEGAK